MEGLKYRRRFGKQNRIAHYPQVNVLIVLGFNDTSTLWIILCHLPEKKRRETETVEEMKERNREESEETEETSKFHGEFMSPALFLFEVLKMGKLTRGPLVLYHRPKY